MSATSPPRRATSSDVARHVGLSRTTVSQILNGNVSQFPTKTRARVEAAAAELNYRPSRAGRALVTGLSDMVVVTFPSITFGPHLQDAVDQITEASVTLGMSVVVRFAGRSNDATLTSVLDLRPMAVIDFGAFSPAQARTIQASGSQMIPSPPDAGKQGEDEIDLLIGRLQVRELTRRGKHWIVYARLEDARSTPHGDLRLQAVRAECAALGLPDPIEISVRLDDAAASDALRSVLSQTGENPIGVCAYNDDVAIAVMAATRRQGRDVPSKVGVIGVDHTAIGQLVSPRLATVHIDLPRMIDTFLKQLGALRQLGTTAEQGEVDFRAEACVWVVDGDSC